MGEGLKIQISRLVPTKRMDVDECHYKLLQERPEIVPRLSKFVRQVVHYGVYKDRGELQPVHVFPHEDKYLIARNHALALTYKVLGLNFPVSVITPFDLMRETDKGSSAELTRAKNRLVKLHVSILEYRKECAARGINTLDDLLSAPQIEALIARAHEVKQETRARVQEYDTRRLKRRLYEAVPLEPSFQDLEATGLEAEQGEALDAAKNIILDYIKRRNGHV